MGDVVRGRLSGAIKLMAGVLLAAGLSACAGGPGQLADAKPHPGVAKAKRLPVHGIDVSRYQGKIDWASVRAAGTDFAFIKATEGGDYIDPRFAENWEGARRAGVMRGAYHFVYWCRPGDQQAEWFRRNVPNEPDALPPVLDVEWNPDSRTCKGKISKPVALEMIRTILHAMEQHTGKRPIIYTDINFHRDILEGELLEYPHWVRSTAAEPEHRYDNRRWTMWQYTTTGRVPGITGDVDRNAFYGSKDDWAQFAQIGCDTRFRHCATQIARARQGGGTQLAYAAMHDGAAADE